MAPNPTTTASNVLRRRASRVVASLLASDAGRYLTGAVVPIDGGHAMSA
jgi:hypothetical protein